MRPMRPYITDTYPLPCLSRVPTSSELVELIESLRCRPVLGALEGVGSDPWTDRRPERNK